MTDVRTNIFGIGEVYELQRDGLWVEKNRETYREYGYFGSGTTTGNPGSGLSIVDRIDYSNDTATASVRGPLTQSKRSTSGSGNSNFGYFSGGFTTVNLSTVDRIDYANDLAAASVRGNLIDADRILSATGNFNFSWIGGGNPNVIKSTVQRIDYSNDLATASVRGPLYNARGNSAATGNSNFGYFGGGFPTTSAVDRINYSNDTATASVRGTLSLSRYELYATGNSNFGYYGGGTPGPVSTVDRIDYSNDTATASVRGPLSSEDKRSLGATGNSNFGYYGGGRPESRSTVDRIDYANDTQSVSVRGPLSLARNSLATASSHSFGGAPVSYLRAPWVATSPFGYFGGGSSPGPTVYSAIERIDYSNDTDAAILRGPLTIKRGGASATGNAYYGYFAGGLDGVPTPDVFYSTIERIDYSNDTNTSVNNASLTGGARRQSAATGNSNFGYFGGGINPGVPATYSTIDRLDYANDAVNTSIRGPLTSTRYIPSATGNKNFGYWIGSRNPDRSTIDRLDYSNDLVDCSPRGLSTFNAGFRSGVTVNDNYGYSGGGFNVSPSFGPGGGVSAVERIDFSNDTATVSRRGNLSFSRSRGTSTGNSNFGYWGGTNTVLSRVDFSNDTELSQTRGNLLAGRSFDASAFSSQAFGGVPNTTTDPLPVYIRDATKFDDSNTLDLPFKRVLGSFGYFMSGNSSPLYSVVDRIDYSNDTAIASVRGNTRTSHSGAAVSNINYGYLRIGWSNGNRSTIDRIDFSNDSVLALSRGNVTFSGPHSKGLSAINFGYFVSGFPGPVSRVDRLDYSNDSANTLPRGDISTFLYLSAATGNSNFGYYCGGLLPIGINESSLVNRIDYSNDSAKTSFRSPLSIRIRSLAATGNSNFGYFGGGYFAGNGNSSTVDRINYSNDLAAASVRGPLNSEISSLAASGNSDFGYFGGGATSSVDRIDYTNDTAIASVRGPLSSARSTLTATTNARNS